MNVKRQKRTESPDEQYFHALALLDHTAKYLKMAGCDPATIHTLECFLRYLRDKTSSDIRTMLGSVESPPSSLAEVESDQEADDKLVSLTTEQLRQMLTDSKLPRKSLERIARIRFGVSTGALSTLRDKESLRNKLLTMIANEATHESIAKIARGSDSELF